MSTLNAEQIAQLVELYEQTTQGEWRNEGDFLADENTVVVGTESYNWRMVAHCNSDFDEEGDPVSATPPIDAEHAKANADWLAAVHNAFPALLETLAEKEAEIERLSIIERHAEAFNNQSEQLFAELEQANERVAELKSSLLALVHSCTPDGIPGDRAYGVRVPDKAVVEAARELLEPRP